MSSRPLLQRNLTEFFRDLLQSAMHNQAVHSSEDSEFYLVKLLEGFAHAPRDWFSRPLALEYLESFHSPVTHRYGKLKRVGDTALFISGLFMESLHRQVVSSDYYVQLGRTAYAHLSELPGEGARGDLFAELAERFQDFVRVLAEISFESLFRGDVHTLRVYTRWMYTRSDRDARWLLRHGVIPYAPASRRPH
ncbi:MAG TPA: hypothetical protein VMW56_19600 [Candidatus Margulisiibacteriota bacterium]|nr:hypothetical protein [Candidatus Margulisiibacteriota bacterium]